MAYDVPDTAIPPCSDHARRLLADMDEALSSVEDGHDPPGSCIALPRGLDRSLLKPRQFSVRTRNCLESAGLFSGCEQILADDLLRVRNFGRTSLRDVLLVVKDYLTECRANAIPNGRQESRNALGSPPDTAQRHLEDMSEALAAVHAGHNPPDSCVALPHGLDRSLLRTQHFNVRTSNVLTANGLFNGTNQILVEELRRLPNFGRTSLRDLLVVVENYLISRCVESKAPPSNTGVDRWMSIKNPLSGLLAAASELHGATSIADLFAPEIAQLAAMIDVDTPLRELDINSVSVGHRRLSAVILTDAQHLYKTLKPKYRTVLDRRILAEPPDTMERVGSLLGVTKARVQQINSVLMTLLRTHFGAELSAVSSVLKAQFSPVARERSIDTRIASLISDDGTPGAALARKAIKRSLGYTRTMNGVCLDTFACGIVDRMQQSARSFAEDGIVDQERLKSIFPGNEWEQHWELLLMCCGFFNLFGFLALRDSDRARTKAALLSIGVPATRDEIADLCGVSATIVSSYLHGFSNVVRADMSRWGLSEWIEHPYEGIEEEITRRIEEGGGVTTTSRLLKELPERFGVGRSYVRTCMQGPRFVLQSNGCITLAGTSPAEGNQ